MKFNQSYFLIFSCLNIVARKRQVKGNLNTQNHRPVDYQSMAAELPRR